MFGTPPGDDRKNKNLNQNPEVEIWVDGVPISLKAWRARKKIEYTVDFSDYVTSAEIMEILRVDHSTLERWRSQGKIGHKKWGGRWHYAAADLAALANES